MFTTTAFFLSMLAANSYSLVPIYKNCSTWICPENSHCVDCYPKCPKASTCQQPLPRTDVVCTAQCLQFPSCVCDKGYVKSGPLNCVKPYECKEYCSVNQTFTSGNQCTNKRCDKDLSHCEKPSVEGCFCKKGYYWDEILYQCVLKPDCSKISNLQPNETKKAE